MNSHEYWSESKTAMVFEKIATNLIEMHKSGITHGAVDLKNIVIDDEDNVYFRQPLENVLQVYPYIFSSFQIIFSRFIRRQVVANWIQQPFRTICIGPYHRASVTPMDLNFI